MRLGKVKGIQMTNPGLLFHSRAFLLPHRLKAKTCPGNQGWGLTFPLDSRKKLISQQGRAGLKEALWDLCLGGRSPGCKKTKTKNNPASWSRNGRKQKGSHAQFKEPKSENICRVKGLSIYILTDLDNAIHFYQCYTYSCNFYWFANPYVTIWCLGVWESIPIYLMRMP